MSGTICRLSCTLSLIATAAFGQAINVVVLNAKNGRAVPDAEVWVQFYEASANRALKRIQYKTGPDGAAHIQLVAPLPAQITLSASAVSFYLGFLTVATADVVSRGAVSRCDPKASVYARTAKPGEVIFLVRRIPWWVRLLAPLEKE
jgi:hypothetical protein